ncbi:hypothetical protein [Compostimonas suwonensis]|uniref:Uncharacterized protein n=1 Tax=Compostimonas suwonensis TaxID=1048394 RepID=A0A2M9BZN1_9MICO|nr:hypothetical protein [Compostimonas suwonensis]PJJ63534.1 hypothetical protein CLV54_1204 [Compostimonas suwonensis]
MSDTDSGTVYIVEYIDGPLEGETDRRLLIGGEYDARLGAVAAVEGKESLFWYNAVDSRDIQGQLHVRYSFERADSDPVAADPDDELTAI